MMHGWKTGPGFWIRGLSQPTKVIAGLIKLPATPGPAKLTTWGFWDSSVYPQPHNRDETQGLKRCHSIFKNKKSKFRSFLNTHIGHITTWEFAEIFERDAGGVETWRKLYPWDSQILSTSILNKRIQMPRFNSHSIRYNVTFILSLFILLLQIDFYKPAFWITFSEFCNLNSVIVNQKLTHSNIT